MGKKEKDIEGLVRQKGRRRRDNRRDKKERKEREVDVLCRERRGVFSALLHHPTRQQMHALSPMSRDTSKID